MWTTGSGDIYLSCTLYIPSTVSAADLWPRTHHRPCHRDCGIPSPGQPHASPLLPISQVRERSTGTSCSLSKISQAGSDRWGSNRHPADPYSLPLLHSLQRGRAELEAGEPQHRKQELPAPKPAVSSATLFHTPLPFLCFLRLKTSHLPFNLSLSHFTSTLNHHFSGEPSLCPASFRCQYRDCTTRADREAEQHPSPGVLLNVFRHRKEGAEHIPLACIIFLDQVGTCSTHRDVFPRNSTRVLGTGNSESAALPDLDTSQINASL